MSEIKVLPENIANKIAAGEVVDRPGSVVKELVENSIDAEANHITVVIEQAGKELIQVIDDGIGINETDVELAFQRHATSKIVNIQDLDRIITLGFRGEALPSIASVSRVEVKTCAKGEQVGTSLKINGGVIEKKEKTAFKQGTTISVKNLFFNTPGRRNFLRTDTTEFNRILKWLKRFFLAYPEIHFSLIHNGDELYNLPPVSQDERISQIFGQKFYDGLVYIREELNDITLEGYVCRPDQTRGNTDNQFIYLNRRTIVNRSLAHAVFQGYGNLIERSQYPQFMMFLHIPPRLVDINVHPTKMEVRFANERVIYHLFLSAVRKAIQSKQIIPEFKMKPTQASQKEIENQFQNLGKPTKRDFGFGALQGSDNEEESSQISFAYDSLPKKRKDSEDKGRADIQNGTYQANLWQVHSRYIVSQIKSGLVIIDQHVAHERILYEQILEYLQSGKKVPSQQLLFPHNMDLALEDYLIYSDIKEWLGKIGFVINELSGRTINIEAIPADVKVGNEGKVLIEILDFYRRNEGGEYEPHEKIAAAFSCKNAIKSGEKLTLEAMNALVDQLFRTKEPYFCPHGRPVVVTLDLEELDRKFKRI